MPLQGRKAKKFKESFVNNAEKNQKVNLQEFANLAGFPVDLIKKELFESSDSACEETSLEDLRAAMVNYLNKTMLED